MTLATRVLVNSALKAARRLRQLGDVAVSREVLQDEEVVEVTPPLQLPGDIDRVTNGVPGHSTAEEELQAATETRVTHAPVIRWEIADCLVHPGGIETAGAAWRHRRPVLADLRGKQAALDRAAYTDNGASQMYFGHWLNDACPTALLARPGETVLMGQNPAWSNVPDYLTGFGLGPHPGEHFRVKRLSFFDDFSQGSLKRERYAELRRRMDGHFRGPLDGPRKVYFRRGATGVSRAIANEAAVAAALRKLGYVTIDVAGAQVPDLMRVFRGAEHVVTIDGSHMSHIYFGMPAGGRVLSLIPGDRFTMLHTGYTRAFDLVFGFLVIDPGQNGYSVDLERLAALIELAK